VLQSDGDCAGPLRLLLPAEEAIAPRDHSQAGPVSQGLAHRAAHGELRRRRRQRDTGLGAATANWQCNPGDLRTPDARSVRAGARRRPARTARLPRVTATDPMLRLHTLDPKLEPDETRKVR